MSLRSVRRIVRMGRQVDIINSSSLWTHFDCAVAGRLARRPVVLDMHDIVRPGMGRRVLTAAVRLSSAAMSVSHAVADCVGPAGAGRMRIMVPAVELDRFRPGPADPEMRRRLTSSEADPLIGIVGRIDPEKGVDLVVRAVAALGGAAARAHLVVVGSPGFDSGAYLERLKADADRLLGDRARFVGRMDDVPETLQGARRPGERLGGRALRPGCARGPGHRGARGGHPLRGGDRFPDRRGQRPSRPVRGRRGHDEGHRAGDRRPRAGGPDGPPGPGRGRGRPTGSTTSPTGWPSCTGAWPTSRPTQGGEPAPMRALMVTKFVPLPDDSGGKQRSLAIARRLAERADLVLCAYDDGTADRGALEKLGVDVRTVPWRAGTGRRVGRGVARTRSISAGRFWSTELAGEVRRAAAEGAARSAPGRVRADGTVRRRRGGHHARVLDLHNVESALAASYARARRLPWSAPFHLEAAALRALERRALRRVRHGGRGQ